MTEFAEVEKRVVGPFCFGPQLPVATVLVMLLRMRLRPLSRTPIEKRMFSFPPFYTFFKLPLNCLLLRVLYHLASEKAPVSCRSRPILWSFIVQQMFWFERQTHRSAGNRNVQPQTYPDGSRGVEIRIRCNEW